VKAYTIVVSDGFFDKILTFRAINRQDAAFIALRFCTSKQIGVQVFENPPDDSTCKGRWFWSTVDKEPKATGWCHPPKDEDPNNDDN